MKLPVTFPTAPAQQVAIVSQPGLATGSRFTYLNLAALSPEVLADMRGWIADCAWPDLDPEEVAELTDYQVVRAINRHYAGGIGQFLTDNAA